MVITKTQNNFHEKYHFIKVCLRGRKPCKHLLIFLLNKWNIIIRFYIIFCSFRNFNLNFVTVTWPFRNKKINYSKLSRYSENNFWCIFVNSVSQWISLSPVIFWDYIIHIILNIDVCINLNWFKCICILCTIIVICTR